LIISAPHAKSNGRKTDALVEFVDVYPTLLDLCGMPRNEKLSGVSLKPILDNTGLKGRKAAFSQFVRPYKAIRKFPPTHMGYSVRTKDWRCTYWYDLSTGKVVERELYNLKTDLIEKTNLAGSSRHAKTEAELVAMIEDYRAGRYSKGKP
jgi:iduronate 2-sulfatase